MVTAVKKLKASQKLKMLKIEKHKELELRRLFCVKGFKTGVNTKSLITLKDS